MDLEETEARNDCSGEDQQKFNRPTLGISPLGRGLDASTVAQKIVGGDEKVT
jgi:hypothetical protein